jgi:hypothetical protein
LPEQTTREHHQIAEFARSRLFPAIDEYASAHGLTVSLEYGLLILLAQRLVYQGHDAPAVAEAVRLAMQLIKAKPQDPPAPAPQHPHIADNVIPLRR